MGWFNGTVLYVIIWWTVLFAVLPFGTRPVAEPDSATGWRGAPARPLMARKIVATTLVAALVWGLVALVIRSDLLPLRPPA